MDERSHFLEPKQKQQIEWATELVASSFLQQYNGNIKVVWRSGGISIDCRNQFYCLCIKLSPQEHCPFVAKKSKKSFKKDFKNSRHS